MVVEAPVKTEAEIASMEAAMKDDGVPTTEVVQVDYFAFEETFTVYLPDGKSYVECKALNEGQRRKYLGKVNRDVRLQKATGDAIMRMAPGEEKKALLEESIVGWNLVGTVHGQPNQQVPFRPQELARFLDNANPRIIDIIDKEVRRQNSWLMADATIEDIDEQIKELQELRERKLQEDEGKVG